MLRYLINVFEDALIPMILIGSVGSIYYFRNTNLKKYLNFGLYGGFAFSLVLALLKANTVLISLEFQSIIINSGLILFEFLFMILSFRLPILEELERHREHTISKFHQFHSILYSVLIFMLSISFMPKVMLYVREIPFGESEFFSTSVLEKFAGYFIGIAAAVLISAAVFQMFTNVNHKNASKMFIFLTLIGVISQSLLILKPLLARRILPMHPLLFKWVILGTNYSNTFIFLMLAILFFPPIAIWIRSYVLDQNYKNPAQFRKIKAYARSRRRWSALSLVLILFFSFSLTVLKEINEREPVLSPAEELIMEDTRLKIPVEQVNDGHLHRFEYESAGGKHMRFIIIKKSQTAFGIGLDACEICGPTGYYERNDGVVCKRCDVVMNTSTIGLPGGCNPIPFAYEVADGFIVIQKAELDKIEKNFK